MAEVYQQVSEKSRLVALLLCFFLGYLGIHRFYAGKNGSGVLYLCTYGLLGIGVLVDLILILSGSFTDNRGLPIVDWEGTEGQPVAAAPAQPQPTYSQSPQPVPPPPPKQSDEMFCNSCGAIVKKAETFCRNCGAALQH
ncbi:MAG: NINE protein [Asgard group archaeon]|nr:NINE protein [Asgard group archaeon]